MWRNTQTFELDNNRKLTVLVAEKKEGLASCIEELKEKARGSLLGFFKPTPEQAILYINYNELQKNKDEAQKSLIIIKDGAHYFFYDLTKGAAASDEVKEVIKSFGGKLTDVSGNEALEYFKSVGFEIGKARELSARNLPNINQAVKYAYQQIKAEQAKPEVTRKTVPGKFASDGG